MGIDDPAPIGSSEIGVAGAAEEAVFVRVGLVLCGDGAVRVVAEGHEVDCILTEDLAVVAFEGDCEAGSLVFFEQVGRILAKNLNVDQSVVDPVLGLRLEHVLGAAGGGVNGAGGHHAADLVVRIDLVTDFGGPGAGDELVMGGGVGDLTAVLALIKADARAHEGQVVEDIDFIEGQPVVDEALELSEEGRHKALVEVDHLAAAPPAVFFDQVDRAVKMGDRDKRLDVVLAALLEEFAVEFDSFAVGLDLVAVRVDSGPGNRKAVDREAHFGEEFDIFFEMVVHIDAFFGRVEVAVFKVEHRALAAGDEAAERPVRYYVNIGEAAAVEVVGAFALIGGGGAAPEKA